MNKKLELSEIFEEAEQQSLLEKYNRARRLQLVFLPILAAIFTLSVLLAFKQVGINAAIVFSFIALFILGNGIRQYLLKPSEYFKNERPFSIKSRIVEYAILFGFLIAVYFLLTLNK